jgi:hypothetical protein
MTNGQLVVNQARKYLGVRETGYNSGPYINGWEARWGMYGEPWCGIFADAMFAEAGVSDAGICHPSVAEIVERGKNAGAIWNRQGKAPVGSLWCKYGVHVAIVISDLGNGSVYTISGNHNSAVGYATYPLAGNYIVIPPAIKADYVEPVQYVTKYYIEDLVAEPYVYRVASGKVPQWDTKTKAQHNLDNLIKSNPAKFDNGRARVVRIGNGNYAIQLGAPRVYGAYVDKAARDRGLKLLEARLGRTLRPYSVKIKV